MAKNEETMGRFLQGKHLVDGVSGSETSVTACGNLEIGCNTSEWIFSRQEIENSPSRRDGIDFENEAYLRHSYSTFVQDLGMRLKFPQACISTAIVLCHRFFHIQSHAKWDRFIIATACMCIAVKLEGYNLKVLLRVISTSMAILRGKANYQHWIEQQTEENYEYQIWCVEQIVLKSLRYHLQVHHPYELVIEAVKKFGGSHWRLVQIAWNLLNDGYHSVILCHIGLILMLKFLENPVIHHCCLSSLRTSLWLQFNHHHIAAGAIFTAARFLRIKIPVACWKEFNAAPSQLQEICKQLVEFYEKYSTPNAPQRNQPGISAAKNCQILCVDESNKEVVSSGRNSQAGLLSAERNQIKTLQVGDTVQGQKLVHKDMKYSSRESSDPSKKLEILPPEKCQSVNKSIEKTNASAGQSKMSEVYIRCLEERQGSELASDRPGDLTIGNIHCNLTQDDSKCTEKNFSFVDRHKPDKKYHINKIPLGTSQVEELDLKISKDRPTQKPHIDISQDEAKGGNHSTNRGHFSSADINYVNKENVREDLKRNSTRKEGRNSKPDISQAEMEDVLNEWVESGVQVTTPEEEAKKNKNKYSSDINHDHRGGKNSSDRYRHQERIRLRSYKQKESHSHHPSYHSRHGPHTEDSKRDLQRSTDRYL